MEYTGIGLLPLLGSQLTSQMTRRRLSGPDRGSKVVKGGVLLAQVDAVDKDVGRSLRGKVRPCSGYVFRMLSTPTICCCNSPCQRPRASLSWQFRCSAPSADSTSQGRSEQWQNRRLALGPGELPGARVGAPKIVGLKLYNPPQ